MGKVDNNYVKEKRKDHKGLTRHKVASVAPKVLNLGSLIYLNRKYNW
jgi:hypothetical protein